MKYISFVLALFLAASAISGQALGADSYAKGTIARGSDLYLIQWQCVERTAPKSGSPLANFFRALGWQTSWQGFGFYFTKGAAASPMSSSTISNVSGLLGAQIVYIVDKDGTSESLYNTRCNGQLVVKGSDNPHLQIFRGDAVVTNEILAKFSKFVTATVTPLYNVFVGAALPQKQADILKNSTSILDAYSTNILPLFVNSHAVTRPSPLQLGRYVFRSPFADVTLTVTKPESLLLSPAAFKSGVSEIITESVAVSAADLEASKLPNLRNKCNSVLQEWSPVGLKSDIDRAYVMYRAIAPYAPTKEAIIRCLGRTYAFAALPYLGKKHFDLPYEWVFTSEDLDRFVPKDQTVNAEFGTQPQGWAKLVSTVTFVGDRAGRELRGAQADAFHEKFAPTLRIEDETANYAVLKQLDPSNKGVSLEGPPQEIFAKLRATGYGKWACIVETDSSVGSVFKSDRNEAVIALANVSGNEPSAPGKATAIRLLFAEKVIRSIVFTDYFDVDKYSKSVCSAQSS